MIARDRRIAPITTVERLEPRRLLSASLTAAFTGNLPAAILPNGTGRVAIRLSNSGPEQVTGPVTVDLYASSRPDLGSDALLLTRSSSRQKLLPGRATTVRFRFTSPAGLADGRYYIVAKVEPAADRAEASTAVTPTFKAIPFIQPFVDLSAQIVKQPAEPVVVLPKAPGVGGASVLVFNAGNSAARGSVSIQLYLSASRTFQAGAPVIGGLINRRLNLNAAQSKVFPLRLTVPQGTTPGTYYLFARVEANGIVETNLANNFVAAPAPLVITDTAPIVTVVRQHHRYYYQNDHGTLIPCGSDLGIAAGIGVLGGGISDAVNTSQDTAVDNAPPPEPSTSPATQPDTGPVTQPTNEPTTQPSAPEPGSDPGAGSSDSSGAPAGDTTGGGSDASVSSDSGNSGDSTDSFMSLVPAGRRRPPIGR